MKKFFSLGGLVLCVGLLSSCFGIKSNGEVSYTVSISKSGTSACSAIGEVITPDEIELEYTMKSIQDYMPYYQSRLPSTGNSKMLVIPVTIPGYEDFATAENKENIQKAFFGDASETGWESVASYYEESSYNQLHLSGTVLDWYKASNSGLTSASKLTASMVEKIAQDAIKANNINTSDYDSDGDGYIDSIWMIYSCPDYSNYANNPFSYIGYPQITNENYWAYTSWTNNAPDEANPTINVYGWASIDFMDGAYSNKVDAHTYIHETGHMMGLNDYYDYASSPIAPLGTVDMMDFNIGDHNMYSKMLLGWIKPYVVTGKGDAAIQLSSTQYKDSAVVILDDSTKLVKDSNTGKYLFNPFGEYMLVELYTPEGLNKKDTTGYTNNSSTFKKEGFKVMHVDNHLFVLTQGVLNSSLKISDYTSGSTIKSNQALFYFISNSSSGDYAEKKTLDSYGITGMTPNNYWSEIVLIDETAKYSYSNLYTAKNGLNSGIVKASDSALFQNGDSFSIARYSKYFVNGNNYKFDNGNTFSGLINFN